MASPLSHEGVAVKVISRPLDNERRRLFEIAATESRIEWNFFDAHSAAVDCLICREADQFRMIGRALEPNEIGCYSSHFQVWREFLASSDKILVVLEDDVVVDWSYLEFITSQTFDELGVSFLKLFNKVPVKQRRIASPFLTQYHHLVQNLNKSYGTQAYIMTRRSAEVFVAHCSRVVRPIDAEMDRAWSHGIPTLSIMPAPAFERFISSSIGSGRFPKQNVGWSAAAMRLVEFIRRQIFNLKSQQRVRKGKG